MTNWRDLGLTWDEAAHGVQSGVAYEESNRLSDATDARTTIQSRGIAEGNLGDEPGQANYARIKSVACSLLNKDRQP